MTNTFIKYTNEDEVLVVKFCGIVFYDRQFGIALDGWRDVFNHLMGLNQSKNKCKT